MANLKTMKAAADAVSSGQTRESQAKKFKVSVSTIDAWRQKLGKVGTATTTIRTGSKVAKKDTRLAHLEAENSELTKLVGRMFLAISRSGRETTRV